MIKPTVGRVVWFYPSDRDQLYQSGYSEPRAAVITRVWGDRMVNLSVADTDGNWHPRTSVSLIQEGDPVAANWSHCAWMPYQVGQAKRHEAMAATA